MAASCCACRIEDCDAIVSLDTAICCWRLNKSVNMVSFVDVNASNSDVSYVCEVVTLCICDSHLSAKAYKSPLCVFNHCEYFVNEFF